MLIQGFFVSLHQINLKKNKTMTITYTTAQLAKEKGYWQEIGVPRYNSEGKLGDYRREDSYSAPQQSELQEWLWETFTIHLSVIPVKRREERQIYFQYRIVDFRDEPLTEKEVLFEHQYSNSFEKFESPYKCLEKGLQEALKLIKNELY